MTLTLFGGTGIIGSYYRNLFSCKHVPRGCATPLTKSVLYLISTTDNGNIYINPKIDIHTNLTLLATYLEKCRDNGVTTFNFVSSWFVYGSSYEKPSEENICNPKGFYSVTKYAAEKLVTEYCEAHDMNWRILRLGNVYGGPDKGTKKRNALHYLIEYLKEDLPIEIYNNLSRDYIHILDTCIGINVVCTTGKVNTIYNIGTGIETSFISCIEKAKNYLKSKSHIKIVDPPGTYQQAVRFSLDCTKLYELGFVPFLTTTKGIKDLCLFQKYCTPDLFLTEKKSKQLLKHFKKVLGTQPESM